MFNAIKQSKQTVTFNYYNDKDQVEFSWVVDGTQLEEIKDSNVQDNVTIEEKESLNIFVIIAAVELIAIVGLGVYCINLNKKIKNQ